MEIRFHKSLYPKKALEEAIEAFRDTVNAVLSKEGDYWSVFLETTEPGTTSDEVLGEFQNYVLGVTIARRGNA